jgi:hypothetical protein
LTVYSREQLAWRVLEQGETLKLAAASFNVSAKTAAMKVEVSSAGDPAFHPQTSRTAHHLYSP